MFIAMNRFKIIPGKEKDFINLWKNRETHLDNVSGFKKFNLLQGLKNEEFTLFASHSTWKSKELFDDWTKSEAFRKAHANAGGAKNICIGKPEFEWFEIVV